MIYRVYSDYSKDLRTNFSIASWNKSNITNIPISDGQLNRNLGHLPFLKDLLDIGFSHCQNDDDIILYTNSDIGVVSGEINLPNENFFCIRKQVSELKEYTSEELENISYELSINCDVFGITKKWYADNRNKIPDFLIGSPYWDIALVILLKAKRINNLIYHIDHKAPWKENINSDVFLHNKNLYYNFLKPFNLDFVDCDKQIINRDLFFKYMSENHGYSYLLSPVFISFYTPSHRKIHDELFKKSLNQLYKDKYVHLVNYYDDQLCESGSYHENGWRKTQVQKFTNTLSVINKLTPDQIFIFCDVDILNVSEYIEDIKEKLKDCDMVAQRAYSKRCFRKNMIDFCSGFFAGKVNQNSKAFIAKILADLQDNDSQDHFGDQHYMNLNLNMLNIKPLNETYFNPGVISKGHVINGYNDELIIKHIPKNVKIAVSYTHLTLPTNREV